MKPALLRLLSIILLLTGAFGFGLILLAHDQNEVEASFGIKPGASYLAGYMFEDINGNGVRNGGEPNLHRTDATYYTIAYSGTSSGTLNTDGTAAPGNNITSGSIPAGNYTVSLTILGGLTATTSTTVNVTVPIGGSGNFFFGVRLHRLNGLVFDDKNWNGTFESGNGEVSLAGRHLTAMCGFSVCGETDTNTNGSYPNYETLHRGPITTWSTDKPSPTNEWVYTVPSAGVSIPPIPAGSTYRQDFGLRHTPIIEGRVCDDQNSDGVCQAGEPNLDSITLDFTTPVGGADTISTPATNTPSCSNCNYTTVDAWWYNPLYPGSNEISVQVPAGRVLTGAPQPRVLNLSDGQKVQEDFSLGPAGGSNGTVTGFVWDDLDRDKAKGASEVLIYSSNFSIGLYDSGGTQVGTSNPDPGNGTYTFSNVPAGDNYEVRLSTASGYCDGNDGIKKTGWNDSVLGIDYTNNGSPYETGEVIDVSSGGTSTANLGTTTDYYSYQQPSGNQNLVPGSCLTLNFFVAQNPCWIGETVEAEFVPDSGWPAEIWVNSVNPSNPANLNPNEGDPNNRKMAVEICSSSSLASGSYPYQFTADHAGYPGRNVITGGDILVNTWRWLQVQDSDVYGAYNGVNDAIDFVLPDGPHGNYTHFLVDDRNSPWSGGDLGGMPMAPVNINVIRNPSGNPAENSRDWVMENYADDGGSLSFPVTSGPYSKLSNECDFNNLPAGGACKFSNTSFPSTYNLDDSGVAVVYASGNVRFDNDFLPTSVSERVVIVADGTVSIDGDVGSDGDPGGQNNPENIDALVVTLGGRDIIVEAASIEDWHVKVRGGLYASGTIDNQRDIPPNNLIPSLVVMPDSTYFNYSIFGISSSRILWQEVLPLSE